MPTFVYVQLSLGEDREPIALSNITIAEIRP